MGQELSKQIVNNNKLVARELENHCISNNEIIPVKIPNTNASFLDTMPRGMGRNFVLSIALSISSSNHILIAAEEPAPIAIAVITIIASKTGISPGAKNIPTIAVKITRLITLGFMSSK